MTCNNRRLYSAASSRSISVNAGLAGLVFALFTCAANAQIQIGTLRLKVVDPAGASVQGANATLRNKLTGFERLSSTDERGSCEFNNVPFDNYQLQVRANQFAEVSRSVEVRSNVPVEIELRLVLTGASETVNVESERGLIEAESSSTELDLDRSSIRRAPGSQPAVQQLIATMPGWSTENNGLLHIRGVDDGILFVVDGIPIAERLDPTFAAGLDTAMISSMNVLTGNIPAEFGGKSGGVVTVQPVSGIRQPLTGTFETGVGSFRAREIDAALTAGNKKAGIFAVASGSASHRFLDPVHPDNLNNRGGALRISARGDWHPSPDDYVIVTASINGSDFRVPNNLSQELAGQRQRQEVRDRGLSVGWQRTWSARTVTNVAIFDRFFEARLIPSPFDTPISAGQDRHHSRSGLVLSITHQRGKHTLKAGTELSRVTPHEFFQFAVTDADVAAEAGISDAALAFDTADPFVFADRKTRGLASMYLQDNVTPLAGLTISAGVRYDHSRLLVSDQQLSPRIGAVYYVARSRTAIRGSFNRLYMPPQIENLLLSDSEQARALSPFVGTTGGGAGVRPEKTSAYEAGFSQDCLGLAKLDAVYWWRNFRNYDDPNVFFSTTVVFPNSVARGFARGVDVRLDVPERNGWSGYVSYTNQRILQTGPINGGLFLTDEVIEIGPGTKFIPDHDERNVASAEVMYRHLRSGLWAALSARHESGVPLEVDEDRIEELKTEPGAELVDFNRQRVRPWTVLNFSIGADLFRTDRAQLSLQLHVQNLADRAFAYNFGNPFEGTHFGYPRLVSGRVRVTLR